MDGPASFVDLEASINMPSSRGNIDTEGKKENEKKRKEQQQEASVPSKLLTVAPVEGEGEGEGLVRNVNTEDGKMSDLCLASGESEQPWEAEPVDDSDVVYSISSEDENGSISSENSEGSIAN